MGPVMSGSQPLLAEPAHGLKKPEVRRLGWRHRQAGAGKNAVRHSAATGFLQQA